MIELYLLSVGALRDKNRYEQALVKLDEERVAKVLQAKRTEDKILRMGAGLLLQYAVKKRLEGTADESSVFVYGKEVLDCKQIGLEELLGEIREPLAFSFKYGPHGKPYLEQYPDMYFSLSHSGEWVVCAIADKEIGADVQEVPVLNESRRKREENIIEKYYSEREKDFVCKEREQWRQRFYKVWAAKEAFMKLTGKGLAQGFDCFEVDFESKRIIMEKKSVAMFYDISAPGGYTIAVCAEG